MNLRIISLGLVALFWLVAFYAVSFTARLAGAGIAVAQNSAPAKAISVLYGTPANPKVSGLITFSQNGNAVEVSGTVHGLQPNQKHGFHVHEFGDCSADDASSAGAHYNPEKTSHGLPPKTPRHPGDFGNLQADKKGDATFRLTADQISISGGRNNVIGHALIVHAQPDKGTQPAGDAGGRIACGVIGIANSGASPAKTK